MKRMIARAFLITVCMIFFSSGQSNASNFIGDIEIFKDCSVLIPANVLFLIDTSSSMMKKDAIFEGADKYSPPVNADDNGFTTEQSAYEKTTVYYYGTAGWVAMDEGLNGANYTIDDIECIDAKEWLKDVGYFEGKIDLNGHCDSLDFISRKVATGDYLNYQDYLQGYMETMTYGPNDYDSTIDYGSEGYGENDYVKVKMEDPRPRYKLYEYDALGVRRICATSDKYYDEIHCAESVLGVGGDSVEECTEHTVNKALLGSKGWARMPIHDCLLTHDSDGLWDMVYTGNFLNYLELKKGRRYVTIRAMKRAIYNNPNLRYGIMQFDLDFDGAAGLPLWSNDGGDLALPCNNMDFEYTYKGETKTHREMLKIILDGGWEGDKTKQYMQPLHFANCLGESETLCEAKWSPLAESLVEAGLYLAGNNSWFNSYSEAMPYTSPIQCADQENFVVILSDGKPHSDFTYILDQSNWIRGDKKVTLPDGTEEAIGNSDGDGDDKVIIGDLVIGYRQKWLDDVAHFFYTHDISDKEGDQKVITFPIGLDLSFTEPEVDHRLMRDTADNGQGFTANSGNGVYHRATNEEEIGNALNHVLSVTENFTFTFSSASTPISVTDSTYSGNDVFTTGFQLKAGHRGEGNITKYVRSGYKIQGADSSGTITDLFDSSSGTMATGVVDLWTPVNPVCPSNEPVPCTGAAYVLKQTLDGVTEDPNSISTTLDNVAAVRTLKTAYGSGTSWTTVGLTDSAVIGSSPFLEIKREGTDIYTGDELKRFLVKKVYGLGLDWPLGDVLHSNMIVAQYPNGTNRDSTVTSYIFSGHNDGMLHCFDASDGSEVWGFVPPDIFTDRLNDLKTPGVGNWFVDGGMVLSYTSVSPSGTDYKIKTPKYLVVGERRGGTSYHVLDVSTKDSPSYEFPIGGTAGWGQSWSKPKLCQVKTSPDSAPQKGVLVGGGYDVNQDKMYPGNDSNGMFIAIYDFLGTELKRFPETVTIDACVVGASIIDNDHDESRVFNRVYAGDLKGRVYHFADDLQDGGGDEIEPASVDGSWYEHRLFKAQTFEVDYEKEDGTSASTMLYQKIFHAPVMGYACDQSMVFFGTGDREHPMRKDMTDSIYAVNDNWLGVPYTSSNLVKFELTPGPAGTAANGITPETYTVSDCEDSCGADDSCKAQCAQRNAGWYFDFPAAHDGEKLISEPLVVGGNMIFGSYTPPTNTGAPASLCDTGTCITGDGRIYVVNTCSGAFSVKSYQLTENPMPQPSLIFDKDTGKVLINTGSGKIIDPEIPVVVPDYWKHSGSAL